MRILVQRLLSRARSLYDKFRQYSETRYIDEAITLVREALRICTPGHAKRSTCLGVLTSYIWTRYEQLGGIENINEAIVLSREALTLCPRGHSLRAFFLNSLAGHLWGRYNELGGADDLNEAIRLNRDALALRPPGHPDRSVSLHNLGSYLGTRYDVLRGAEDLDKAICLHREALVLRPPGHPDRSMTLSNLANYLGTRSTKFGGVEDLDEAICLQREALALRPPGHPHRSRALNNLAVRLCGRYRQLGELDDLDEAICLDRDALTLRPPGHPDRSMSLNNLARNLWTRYNNLGGVDDLDEVIRLDRDALVLRPPGHPRRSWSLNNLATHLSSRYKNLRESQDRDEIFRLYHELAQWMRSVSSSDLTAAKAWINAAEEFHHPTMRLAYETTLQLLVHHLAALPPLPQHLTVFKGLTSSLAVDAFSACLRSQSPTNAVELLEQGRGVFWSQLTRLRSPLDDVVASGSTGKMLADEFMRVTSLIRNVLDSPGADQHDRVWRLNLELEKVVSNIRELPAHSRFLLPSLFSDLRRAASGGPVIIVNASVYSCDALLVFADKDPVHIPLSVTKEDVRELSSRLHTLTVRARGTDVTRDLSLFLRELWDRIVSPIVDFLRTTYPRHSRIWWCPTAEFSLLPLHAANPYRKGQQSLASLYISSYTPTLSALIRARQHSTSNLATERKRFLAIGQANATGQSELLSVNIELTNIGQCVDGLTMFTRIEGEESCISRIAEELGKNEWVHLACHGLAHRKQPFESAFALHDGHFTIQHIIQCDLQDSEFAYLSACHTTAGDEESPDEVIHLASAMQFAGFRSVIGTMWAVDDAETNKITSVFYTHMTDDAGCLDHTRAAYALWKTMRSVNVPLDQRILYIHLGA